MAEDESYISAKIPVRLTGSHGISRPGFKSMRKGSLSTKLVNPSAGSPPFVHSFSATAITVLGFTIASFAVGEPADGWQELKVIFAKEQTALAIEGFVLRLADDLTAFFAPSQRDLLYGNLIVEVDWARMWLERASVPESDRLNVQDSVSVTVDEPHSLTPQLLESLTETDLTQVFVEGMRANRPKAKYISWFVMIEELERLAVTAKFSHLFERLFPKKADRNRIANASGLTGKPLERLRSFLGDPNHTVQSRAEKLQSLLQEVGIKELPTPNTTIVIDVNLCQKLINQRNNLAHKGTVVDEDLLYVVLFPLSCRVMEYLSSR
ncbi:MAG TPA: hypothetical protein VGG99_28905 [Acetobacteraceae bacterium]|jgi:hypothetical protein